MADAALGSSVQKLLSEGRPAYVVVKREAVQSESGVVEVPVVSIVTGQLSVYSVTDAAGTQQVIVPQMIQHRNTCLSMAVLEECLKAMGSG